ncbi:hypothetical protein IT398_01075 [Candidatus Nomurabacteria bacterium]|nr:hypothetical protein [Candidatus Nomurabacteria bacterium]
MLYLFSDQNKLERALQQFKKKNPTGTLNKFDNENWLVEKGKFEELLASGISLFGEKNIIILRDIEELTDSERERIEKSETIVLWLRQEVEKSVDFDFFALSNSLVKRDRARLWLGYQKALAFGVSAEEVFWRSLWWQVRKLRDSGLSSRLVRLWHDTKREEGRDFSLELELFLLTV